MLLKGGQFADAATLSQASSPQAVRRDDTYYMDDGSLVLQVENTLFNVRPVVL